MKKESNKPSYEELQLKIVEEEIKRNKVYDELSEVKHNLENLKKEYDNVVFEKDSITNSTIWRKTAFIRRILDRLNNKSIKKVPCNSKKENNEEVFESALNGNDNSHLFTDSIIKPLIVLDKNVYSDNIHGYGIQIRDRDRLSFIKKSNKKYFFVLDIEELLSDYENTIRVIKDGIDNNYLRTNNKYIILLKDFDKYYDNLKEKIESLRAVFNNEVEIWTSDKKDNEESIFDNKLYHLKYEGDNYTFCLEELRKKLYCDKKIIPYIDLVNLETSSSIREVYLLMRVLLSYNSINNKDNYIFVNSPEDNKLYDVLKKCSYNFDSIINTPSYYVERYKNRTIRYIGCGLDKTNIYEEDMTNNVVIAVQAHVFYPELIDEIIEYTNNIPYAFDLYISTVDLNKKLYITKKLENSSKAVHFYVDCFDNIGRDVIPFLEQLKPVVNKYKYFCHIHTKRSFQNNIGNLWRKYLYDNLLGSANSIREIIEIFETNNSIGLIFPEAYSFVKGSISIAGNMSKMEELFKLLKMNIALKDDDQVNFPSGNMFWGRFEALHNIFEMDLSNYEIPQEAGQTDDTIFHAIERAWCYVAHYNGYDYKQTRYLLDDYPLIECKKHD